MSRSILKPAAYAAAGLGALIGYAHLETKWFTVKRVSVPILPPGQPPITILQLADLHLVANQRTKLKWLHGLADLNPDLVVNTGDNISSAAAIPALLHVLSQTGSTGGRPLLEVPGVFVGGSNDYFAPRPKNAARYLLGPSKTRTATLPKLPWRELFGGFTSRGWVDLNNRRANVVLDDGRVLDFVGTNDAHIGLDAFPLKDSVVEQDAQRPTVETTATFAKSGANVRIGVTHAPYVRVLDEFAHDGTALVIAGHTHGGQLRIPGFGALVTNSDIARKQASGLHRWSTSAKGRPSSPEISRHSASEKHQRGMTENVSDKASMWLYVSAGAGTSPYAPFRFACRPSATLITLTQ